LILLLIVWDWRVPCAREVSLTGMRAPLSRKGE
jgi:hypothetical protein